MTFCSAAWLIVKKTVADQRLNLVSSGRYRAQYRGGILWSVCCLPEGPRRKSCSLPHTHTHTHTHMLSHTNPPPPRVDGRGGIKQHAAVCSAGRIIGGIDGEYHSAHFSAAMLVSQQAGSPERERQIMQTLKRTCIRSGRSSSRFDRLKHVHMRRTNAGSE